MNMGKIMNTIGLLLDIFGVLILFKYGLPADVNKYGEIPMAFEGVDESEKRRYKKYEFRSRIGLTFLVLGFICQLASNCID